ncbi:GntR family transcriptional regulator [Oxalobacteraceae bacterium CAVE-383]|nr:GntR family transcriptional regulator [Oxalobacteraceae bacterium CAVE-383]
MDKLTADQITVILRKRIYDGILAGGLALKQEDLASEFGVSRNPVRESLKILKIEGLVRNESPHGAVVVKHSIADVIEMLDIRIGLETRALKLAIPNLSNAQVHYAEAILAKYDASDKPSEWSDLNLEFHLALYRAANRPLLLKMIEDLVLGTRRYTRVYISQTLGRNGPQEEHHALLAAFKRGDTATAVALLETHIGVTQKALLAMSA